MTPVQLYHQPQTTHQIARAVGATVVGTVRSRPSGGVGGARRAARGALQRRIPRGRARGGVLGERNVAYEGGPLLGAVCKQLAPGGQVLIVGSISQYPHNHNAQKQKESNNEAEAEAVSSLPAHGIPGLEDWTWPTSFARGAPTCRRRGPSAHRPSRDSPSGVLPTITKMYADHAGGTLAALVDETRRFEGVAAAPAAVAHMLAGGNTGKVVVYVSSTA